MKPHKPPFDTTVPQPSPEFHHRCSRPTSDRKGTAKCKERAVVVEAEPAPGANGDHHGYPQLT